jgi:renalase
MIPEKNIVIIGSGIAGLRAALEVALNPNNKITILEKSISVGGRVATRRFGNTFVNHGALNFGGLQRVLNVDPFSNKFLQKDYFDSPATELPKKLKEELITDHGPKIEFKFNWEVSKVVGNECVISVDGKIERFDHLIITAPAPQTEKMTGIPLPEIKYHKIILFFGPTGNELHRIEMDTDWSEIFFDLSDEEITKAAEIKLNRSLSGLTIKKWRYARVAKGLATHYYLLKRNVVMAGDAFDPKGEFNLGSSWLSGFNVGKALLSKTF